MKKKPKKKPANSPPLDYQTAKFLWALAQIVPNNPHLLEEARRAASWDPVQGWFIDALEFLESYEEKYGPVQRATKLPPELTSFKSIEVAPGVSITYTADQPLHSQN